MTDFASLTLSGRLVRDPEFIHGEQTSLASFTLAANSHYRTRQGELQKDVAFVFCKAFGAWAKPLEGKSKGDTVVVAGRLRTESWESNGIKHQRLVVICRNILVVPRSARADSVSADPGDDGSPAEAEDVPF